MAAAAIAAPVTTAARPIASSTPPTIANLLELSRTSPRNSQVQAYAKLEFGVLSYYVQSLSVTLGRKANETDHVDIHLPGTKAISRLHARIQYSFARNAFEIYVGGRNGLFVDDVFYEQGSVVPLEDRTAIQIGEIKFNFLLPHQPNVPEPPLPSDHELSAEEDDGPDESSELSSTITPPPTNETEPTPSTAAEKPDIPYATLIAQSLLSHPQRRRTLQDIYTWIQDHHAYFKSKNKNWQSSIRHNLLSSPAFVHYGPKPGDDGKRGKDEWGISPEYEPLIGNLTAKEGDTDKLSTKLQKKKEKKTPPPPKPPKTTKSAGKIKTEDKGSRTTKKTVASTAPAIATAAAATTTVPAATEKPAKPQEDPERIRTILQDLNAKGVDFLKLTNMLQEAAKITALKTKASSPAASSVQPTPAKRTKPSTSTPLAKSASPPGNSVPLTPPFPMPMPLPYAATKVTPIPALNTTVQIETEPLAMPSQHTKIQTESDVKGSLPLASVPLTFVPPTDKPVIPVLSSEPAETKPVATASVKSPPEQKTLETAAARRSPRGKKRSLED